MSAPEERFRRLQNTAIRGPDLPGLSATALPVRARCDDTELYVSVETPGSGAWTVEMLFDPCRFDRAAIVRLGEDQLALVRRIAAG